METSDRIPTSRDEAVWWLLCHALNSLHEHQGTRTETGCSDGCRPSEDGCCPECCGPCGALKFFAENESNRNYADRLSAKYGKTSNPEAVAKYGQYNWRWQQPLSGVIAWDEVYRCWGKMQDCWCHERDEDIEVIGVIEVGVPRVDPV